MTTVAETLIQQGRQEGIRQGVQQGRQEGIRQGVQQGRQEGIRQGVQQGRQQARQEIMQRQIVKVLEMRLGDVPSHLSKRIVQITDEQTLNQLFQSAILVDSIDTFEEDLEK